MDITSIASTQSNDTGLSLKSASTTSKSQSLDSGDFLKLLITQLTNQDPLKPMEDKEFMAQMAQFSSLDEMSQMNTTMTSFVNSQQAQSASAYLGNDVTILSEGGNRVEGLVTAINSKNADGVVTVTVNGSDYDVKKIQSVRLAQ